MRLAELRSGSCSDSPLGLFCWLCAQAANRDQRDAKIAHSGQQAVEGGLVGNRTSQESVSLIEQNDAHTAEPL